MELTKPFRGTIIAAILAVALLGAYLVLRPAAAGKDTSLERVRDQGELIIGLDPSYPPFEVINGEGQLDGFDVDLSREIARRLGVKARFVPIDFGGLFDALLVGKFDLILGGVSPFPEYERTVAFSAPYFDAGLVLLLQPGATGSVVGIETGSDADLSLPMLRTTLPENQFAQFDDQGEIRQRLAQGTLRGAIVDAVTGTEWSRQIPGLQLRPGRLTSQPFVLGLRKNDQELRQAIDEILAALRANGEIDALVKKWLK